MKKILVVFCISLSAFSLKAQYREHVDSVLVKEWVCYLASDQMKGRANGSQESLEAALYIRDKFKEYGLTPPEKYPYHIQDYNFTDRSQKIISERNVIGVLEGKKGTSEKDHIILTAHLDHIGIKDAINGDSIYNGANDNITGISALLGIARYFQLNNLQPERTLVFVAFSAEEIGFDGSKYYVENPVLPVKRAYVNMNFELLGHCSKLGKKRFYISGPGYSSFEDIVKEYFQDKTWDYAENPDMSGWLMFASDNVSFLRVKKDLTHYHGIPAHTLVMYDGEDHLHKPWDEAKYIDFSNLTGFINSISDFVYKLSFSKEEIKMLKSRYRKL